MEPFDDGPVGRGLDKIALAELLAGQDPASPARLILATDLLAQGRAEAAAEIGAMVGEAHPLDLDAPILTAQALLALGRADQAGAVLARTTPALEKISGRLTELAHLFRNWRERARVAVDLEAAAVQIKAALAGITQPPAPPDFEEEESEESSAREMPAVPTETLANLYLSQGHRDEAIQVYLRLVALEPGNPDLRARLEELTQAPRPVTDPTADEPKPLPEPAARLATSVLSEPIPAVITAGKARLADRLSRLRDAARRRRTTAE